MKTKLALLVVVASLVITVAGYGYFFLHLAGQPKDGLPPVGKAIKVEASFQGSFVGTSAGERRYYKFTDKSVNLVSGRTYEVVETKKNAKIYGPPKKTLKLIQ